MHTKDLSRVLSKASWSWKTRFSGKNGYIIKLAARPALKSTFNYLISKKCASFCRWFCARPHSALKMSWVSQICKDDSCTLYEYILTIFSVGVKTIRCSVGEAGLYDPSTILILKYILAIFQLVVDEGPLNFFGNTTPGRTTPRPKKFGIQPQTFGQNSTKSI